MSLALGAAPRGAGERGAGERGAGQGWLAGVAVSLVLHGAVVAFGAQTRAMPAALVAAGGGGQDLDTVDALVASFVALPPPAISLPPPQMALPLSAPVIEIPQVVLPDPVRLPPEPPKTVMENSKPAASEGSKPKPQQAERPKRAKPAPQQTESRAVSRAAGTGGGAQAGAGGPDAQASLSAGTEKSLLSKWGATIRARVERRKSYPSAAGRAAGTVTVALTVGRGGELLAATLGHSSGHPALDQAALAALRKAGPFPPAPKGLDKQSYSFSLAIKFQR